VPDPCQTQLDAVTVAAAGLQDAQAAQLVAAAAYQVSQAAAQLDYQNVMLASAQAGQAQTTLQLAQQALANCRNQHGGG
jgi:hypothetical protein